MVAGSGSGSAPDRIQPTKEAHAEAPKDSSPHLFQRHGAGKWLGNWSGRTGDAYVRGQAITSEDGKTWKKGDYDLFFSTYLAQPPAPK